MANDVAGTDGDRNGTSNDIDEFFSTDRTSGRDGAILLEEESYRAFLYPHDHDVLAPYRGMSFEEFTQDRYQAEFLRELLDYWKGLYEEPFVGVTSDGVVIDGVYASGENMPEVPAASAAAAREVLATLSADQRSAVSYDLDAPEWRGWSNPEFVFFRTGLRLEEVSEASVDAVHALLRASLSTQGYARVAEAMQLNGYLGELVDLPTIMNDRSYWFALFGTPSDTEPWGWQLFGHHVALNFVTVGGRDVVAPIFLGAEPALSDGERAPLFDARETLALALAASLSDQQRAQAVVYASVLDPKMPDGRLHPADERHVAGAFRDNRVVRYEGIRVSKLDASQREMVRRIVADFLLVREDQVELTMADIDSNLSDTWFAWYGATDGSGPFYFRVHGPAVLVELDHHAGVWLANRLPARFHVHTTLRHPNGNDYGKALIARWRDRE